MNFSNLSNDDLLRFAELCNLDNDEEFALAEDALSELFSREDR